MELSNVLMELSRANGVSGQEDGAVAAAKKYLEPLVDRTEVTPLGNLIGYRASNKAGAKTVLLDAHLDQVGLVVTGQKNGLLTFTGGVGGVDDRMLPGLQVMVLTDPVRYGVISCGERMRRRTSPLPAKTCALTAAFPRTRQKRFPWAPA